MITRAIIAVLWFAVFDCLHLVDSFSTTTATTFRSCPAPRFDVFAQGLVGHWNNHQAIVEEVMRSCGGAVQGIREIIATNDGLLDDQYLNRADDGFLYQDDGGYSWGPVVLHLEGKEDKCLTSLPLSKGQRVLFGSNDNEPVVLQKQFAAAADLTVVSFPNDWTIAWTRQVRCSMPTPNMPWMAQRLKWQMAEYEDDDGGTVQDSEKSSHGGDKNVVYTACLPRTSAAQLASSSWQVPSTCWVNNDDKSVIAWTAVAWLDHIRAVGREYHVETGQLTSVVSTDGRMQMTATPTDDR